MKKWLTYIGLLIFSAGVIFIFVFAQNKNNAHRINKILINYQSENHHFINDDMVNKLLIQKNGNPLNQLNSTINLHVLEENMRQNEMVESADVYVNPQGELQVNILQKTPIVRIQNQVKNYYLDDNGLPMPLSTLFTERVPLATGIYNEQTEQELFDIMKVIKKDQFLNKQIIGLNRLINGDFMLYPRIGTYKILIGKPIDVEQKMKKLKVFYKKMWNDERLKHYDVVNIKFKDQVVCSY